MFLFFVIAMVIFIAGRWSGAWKSREYIIGSGKPGAGYSEFASGLVELGKTKPIDLKLRAVESEGSVDNMRMLKEGNLDFGLVQEGVTFADNVRAVAAVYNDTVHILVRNDVNIKSVADFKSHRVALGLKSSGTRIIALNLLEHYGVAKDQVDERLLEPRDAVKSLLNGEIDAMIMVTAMRAPMIWDALGTGKISHLTLGIADEHAGIAKGLSSRFPHLKPSVIPRHAYGVCKQGQIALPVNPIAVLEVPSLLVCRDDIPDAAVRAVADAIFSNRYELSKRVPSVLVTREPTDTNDLNYPVHDGAEGYYHRKDPGFLVVYAEVIALMLSGGIAVVGLSTGVLKWMRQRRKNRIDVYYEALNTILKGLENKTVTDFRQEERRLTDLKHRAFDDLINERLTADESFRIFQELLEQCTHELHRQANESLRDSSLARP